MLEEKRAPITTTVVKNSFWNFLMVLFAKIGGLIFTILLARFLLPEKFGVYNLAMSITLILLTFADIGINQSLIRYFSDAFPRKKELAIARYNYLFKLKLILTFAFALFLLVFAFPISEYIFKKPALAFPIIFSSFYLIILSIESFYESFFYITEKVQYLTLKQVLWEILRIFGALLTFVFLASYYYILGVIGVLIISTLIVLLFLLYYLKKFIPVIFSSSQKTPLSIEDKKRINKFLIYLTLGGTLTMIFGYIDTIMIGIFLSAEYVGYYSAAYAFVGGLSSLITVANILLPLFTKLKKQRLSYAFEKVFKYTLIIAVPMVFGLLTLSRYIITTVYGHDYLPAVLPLYFLVFLIIETPITNTLKSLLAAKEKPQYFVTILMIATIMNILLNYIFIISFMKFSLIWAATGAAIATLITRYFYFFGLSIYIKKKIKVRMDFSQIVKPLIASIIMSLILLWINSKVQMSFALGITEVFLGIIIYFSSMLIIKGISKQDFLLLKELFK